jgi:hypothetical protein
MLNIYLDTYFHVYFEYDIHSTSLDLEDIHLSSLLVTEIIVSMYPQQQRLTVTSYSLVINVQY